MIFVEGDEGADNVEDDVFLIAHIWLGCEAFVQYFVAIQVLAWGFNDVPASIRLDFIQYLISLSGVM